MDLDSDFDLDLAWLLIRFDFDSILIRFWSGFGSILIRVGLISAGFRLDFGWIRQDFGWIRLDFGSIRDLGAPGDPLGPPGTS